MNRLARPVLALLFGASAFAQPLPNAPTAARSAAGQFTFDVDALVPLVSVGTAFGSSVPILQAFSLPADELAERFDEGVLVQVGAAAVPCARPVIAAMGGDVRCAVTAVSRTDTLSALENGWPLAELRVLEARDARARWGVRIAEGETFVAWRWNATSLQGTCFSLMRRTDRVVPICPKYRITAP